MNLVSQNLVSQTANRKAAAELLGTPRDELRLRVRSPERGARIVIVRAPKCTVGCAGQCTLQITGPRVQPVHCLLLRGARGNFVRWLTTEKARGQVFRDRELSPGTRLRVGSAELEVLPPAEDARATVKSSPSDRPHATSSEEAALVVEPAIEARMQRLEQQYSQLHRQALQVENDTLQSTVDRLVNQLGSERERHRSELQGLVAERQRLTAELENQSQQLAGVQSEMERLQEHVDHCQHDAGHRVASLSEQFNQFARQKQQTSQLHDEERTQWLTEKSQLEADLAANSDRLRHLQSELADASRQHNDGDRQRRLLESQLSDLAETVKGLTERLELEQDDFRRQQDEWHERRHELEAKLVDTETRLADHMHALSDAQQCAEEQAVWQQEHQELTRQLDAERARSAVEKSQLEAELAVNREQRERLEGQLKEATQQQDEDNHQRTHLESQADELSQTVSRLTEQLESEQEDFRRQQDEWLEQRQALEASLTASEHRLADQADTLGDAQQHAEEQATWQRKHQELTQKVGAERARWLEEKSQLEAELAMNRDRLERLEGQLDNPTGQQSDNQQTDLESQLNDLVETVSRLTEQLEVEQDDFKRLQAEWLEQRQELQAKLAETETKLAEHVDAVGDPQQLAEELASWQQEREELTRQLAELEQNRLRQQEEAQQLNERCVSLQTRIVELEQQIDSLDETADSSPPDIRDQLAAASELPQTPEQPQPQPTDEGSPAQSEGLLDELEDRQQQIEDQLHERGIMERQEERRKITTQLEQLQGRLQADIDQRREAADREFHSATIELLPDERAELLESGTQPEDAPASEMSTGELGPERPEEGTDQPGESVHQPTVVLPEAVAFSEDSADPPVSTADVLARLGHSNSWEPEAVDQPQATQQLSSFSAELSQTPAGDNGPAPDGPFDARDGEESIEQYMNRLLARVRGPESSGSEPSANLVERRPVVEQDGRGPAKREMRPAQKAAPGGEATTQPVQLAQNTSSEDFMPRRQAPELSANLAAMRDLANQSTRTAIATYAQSSWMHVAKTKLLWIAGGLFVSVSSLLSLHTYPWVGSLGLIAGLSIAAYFGWQARELRKRLLESLILTPPSAGEPKEQSDQ